MVSFLSILETISDLSCMKIRVGLAKLKPHQLFSKKELAGRDKTEIYNTEHYCKCWKDVCVAVCSGVHGEGNGMVEGLDRALGEEIVEEALWRDARS